MGRAVLVALTYNYIKNDEAQKPENIRIYVD